MNGEQPELSVIITSFNTAPILEKCLDNLLRLELKPEIIVVDNASTDGSVEMVKRRFPEVILVALGENKGLSFGNNTGAKLATTDLLLFLGSDAFPRLKTLAGLIGYFKEHTEVGVASCRLVLRSGQPDPDAHRGFPTPWTALAHFLALDKIFKGSKIFDRYFQGYKNLAEPHEIDLCISHFMLVRKSLFTELGGFDESFFVYGEDVDFCYRAKQQGWKIMYLPQWEAIHFKGAGVGVRKETRDITTATLATKRKMSLGSAEAMRLFYNKHYRQVYPRLFTLGVLALIALKGQLRALKYR